MLSCGKTLGKIWWYEVVLLVTFGNLFQENTEILKKIGWDVSGNEKEIQGHVGLE